MKEKRKDKEKDKEEDREKKRRKKEKKRYRRRERERERARKQQKRDSESSSTSESDEWVEQVKLNQEEVSDGSQIQAATSSRDEWMSMTGVIATYSRDDGKAEKKKEEKKHIDSYNPATSGRELNPYWKDGGSGLPTTTEEFRATRPFKKPETSNDYYKSSSSSFKRPGNDSDDFYKSSTSSYKRSNTDDIDLSKRSDSNYKRSDLNDDLRKSVSTCDRKKLTNVDFYRNSPSATSLRSLDKDDQFRNIDDSKMFKKPERHDDFYSTSKRYKRPDDDSISQSNKTHQLSNSSSSNWKKRQDTSPNYKEEEREGRPESTPISLIENESEPKEDDQYLTDEKMNKLAAKIVKAEILGDSNLVNKLKNKLEDARKYRKENPDAGKMVEKPEDIMLLSTNSRGDSRPLVKSTNSEDPRSKGGKRKAETHVSGERTKYFSNDDKHSLSEMFEQEKYGTNYDDDAQLASIAAKHTNPNDELEDIFTDEISKNKNRGKEDERQKQRAIKEHIKLDKSLEGCEYCIGSKNMLKHLMVSCGTKVYVAVPAKRSLTKGHCIITTVQHASSATGLDEDVWEEIMNYRKALTNLFNAQDEDVVFFETAVRLHKYPHLVINCVPMPRDIGDTAPIYFKKALLECEAEWSMNKKVVDLKGKNIRKGVPKGLPYFWIDFGMDPGFAHVIEDQQLFPDNFAEEIIGGILDLDHHLWKKPQREQGDQQRKKVSEFVQLWRKFDPMSKS